MEVRPCQQAVAEYMSGPIGALAGRDALARNDIEALADKLADKRGRGGGIVCVVAVDQNIDVRLDIGEHAAHDVALALAHFGAHHGAGLAGSLDRPVLRIVVVDIDRGRRERGAEVAHHLADRGLLVVAGYQDGDSGVRHLQCFPGRENSGHN